MVTERTLSRLIILTPIVTILAFAVVMIYLVVTSQYQDFQRESAQLESEYIDRQKQLLREENEKIHAYINYHRNLYSDQDPEEVKERIIDWIESVRYGLNGYIWVHDTNHHLIAHPFRQESIGKNDTKSTDATGALIFQEFIKAATQNPRGDFVEYYWARPDFGAPAKKIGFLKLEPQYGWVIGTGVYVDDIYAAIEAKKNTIEAQIDAYVRIIILTALALTAIFGIISYTQSRTMLLTIRAYKAQVTQNEQSLKELNATLSERIKEALEEAKTKDKALLHQSRLAQMGEMLSLIAHQWRQPLAEVLGIFMELETAAKFGQADQNYIENEAKEGDKLVRYMSKTIDDFRNFFKPEHKKTSFSIKSACEEALSLANPSLRHECIHVSLHVKEDSMILGYPLAFAQVILNLILNAKDALMQSQPQNPQINIEIWKEVDKAFIKVTDNGGGIDSAIFNQLFEPYVSTKKSAGTGLGLYMAKMIIERHLEGKISVTTSADGTTFLIKIPKQRSKE
jgi:signal transduction histidine kinase